MYIKLLIYDKFKIRNDFIDLMLDPFGNYLCQKIMTLVSENELNFICEDVKEKICHIAKNQQGTRSMQKLLEVIKNPISRKKIASGLRSNVYELSKVIIFIR